MKKLSKILLAGAAAVTIAGTAFAAAEREHVLQVALPDGSVEHVHYSGDVAPKIVILPARGAIKVPPDLSNAFLGPVEATPFTALDRIAADMDRQADAMFREAAAMAARPMSGGGIDDAAFPRLPAGTTHYSFVSTSTGGETCSRSVQMTSFGPDRQPKILSRSSGDCGAATVTPAAMHGAVGAKSARTPVASDAATNRDSGAPARTAPTI